MLLNDRRGFGAIGAAAAVSLGMLLLAGGSQLYLKVKSNEVSQSEMRQRGEVIQQNASALTDKILRGGVIADLGGGVWQLTQSPPESTWSFSDGTTGSPTVASAPVLSFNFCDPKSIFSGQETIANCAPNATATTSILGREPSGKVKLSNYSLVTKAAKSIESRSAARLSGVPLCREYNGTELVENLFRSILGREPSQQELQVIMPCIANGNLLAWDLESNQVDFCGGTVKGLRAMPEYDRRKESVYAAFRSNVGRMPDEGDMPRVNGYLAQLNVPENEFIPALQSVATAIRADYALGSAPYSGTLVNELYQVVYQGAYSPIDVATNPYLLLLARGQATLSTVVDLMRQASQYRSESASISSEFAKRSEGVNFLYYALKGKHINQVRLERGMISAHPFDVSNWYGYHAWMIDLLHSDPSMNGYQWIADMFRSATASDFEAARVREAGICSRPAPRPQCVAYQTNYESISYWNTGATGGYVDGRLCGTPPNHVFVPNTQNCPADKPQSWYVNDGFWYWTIKIPKPDNASANFSTQAFAFGNLSSASYAGAAFTSPTAPTDFSSVLSPVKVQTNLAGGQVVNNSCAVSGLGGSNTFNYTYTIPAQKRSCLVATSTRYSNPYYADAMARNSSRLLMEWYAWVPAPAIAMIGGDDVAYRYVIPNAGTPYPPTASDTRRYSAGVPESIRMGQHIELSGTPTLNWEILRNVEFPLESGGFLGPNLSINVASAAYFFDAPFRYHGIPKSFRVNGDIYNMRTDAINFLTTQDQFRNQSAWGTPDCQYSTTTISPLVVDLFGEGVEFTGAGEGVKFDLGEGGDSSYYWPRDGKKNAFLALDRNQNGKIDNIQELFGDRTLRNDGSEAENGFLALKEFDMNHDNRINQRDPIYRQLVLWFDRNRNGVSEPGELIPLSLAGIKEFDLDYLVIDELADKHGNLSRQRSVVEMVDGSFRTVFDIYVVPNPIF